MQESHTYFEQALELAKDTTISLERNLFQAQVSAWLTKVANKYAHDNYNSSIMKPWDFSRQDLRNGQILLYSVLGGKDSDFTKSSFWHTVGVGFNDSYQLYGVGEPSYLTWHVFGAQSRDGFAYSREIRFPLQHDARLLDSTAELHYFESAYESPLSLLPFSMNHVVYLPDGTCVFLEESDEPMTRIRDGNFINWDCFTFSSEKVGEN